ncbi:zinc-binding dehydrogenase [Rhodococcus sp. NPDC127530]|uniref:zinc-binding dehydrogenase n=1 Tax=unclassified Rhodococcus (in: high G+C Gram-positive bacteria) TaxID=192944 RepID=UPI0036280870
MRAAVVHSWGVVHRWGDADLAEALGCLVPGGRIAVYGSSAGRTATFEVPMLYFGQFTILGTTLGSPTDFGQMLQFVEKHRIRPVIDSTWALDDVVAAHQHLKSRRHLSRFRSAHRPSRWRPHRQTAGLILCRARPVQVR